MEQTSNQPIINNSLNSNLNVEVKEQPQSLNPSTPIEIKSLPHEQLLAALYFAWDGAERAQLDLFLIKDTAKQVKADQDLSGDKITLGVRKTEWNGGRGRIFQEYAKHELFGVVEQKENEVIYTDRKGVPIVIKLYDENECLKSFDIAFYRFETFNLPNPYSTFVEKYE